jgi:hypothetical protein
MAEDTVVKDPLTDAMIRGGAELLKKLDERGVPITAALWLFVPRSVEWRLLFASPEVPRGPKRVYAKVHEALMELSAAAPPLRLIALIHPDDSILQLLRIAVQTGRDSIAYIRFEHNTINGQFIEDALIYRLAPPEQPRSTGTE